MIRKLVHFVPASLWMMLVWSVTIGLVSLSMARPLLSAFSIPNTVILVGRALLFGALVGVLYTAVAWLRAETLKKSWRRVFGATLFLGIALPLLSFFAFPVVIERGVGEIVQFRGNEGLIEQLLLYSLELLYILLTSSLWGFVLGAAGLLSAIVALVALLLVVERKRPTREEILGIKDDAPKRKQRPPTIRKYLREQRGEPEPTLPPGLSDEEGVDEIVEATEAPDVLDSSEFVPEPVSEPVLVVEDVPSLSEEPSLSEDAGDEPAQSFVEAVEAAADSAFPEPVLSTSEPEPLPELGAFEESGQAVAETLLQPTPELPSAYEKPEGIDTVRSEIAAMFDFSAGDAFGQEEGSGAFEAVDTGATTREDSAFATEPFSPVEESTASPAFVEPVVEQSAPADAFAFPTPFDEPEQNKITDNDTLAENPFFLPSPFSSSDKEVEPTIEPVVEPMASVADVTAELEVEPVLPVVEEVSVESAPVEVIEPVGPVEATPVLLTDEPEVVESTQSLESVEEHSEKVAEEVEEEVVESPSSSALDLFSSQPDLPDVDSLFGDDDLFGNDFSFDFDTDDKDKK